MTELTPETLAAARKSLQECLADSVVPREYWDEIAHWLEATRVENLYLVGRDAIGAWWAAKEVRKLGFAINFAKSGCMPGNWFPEGENWDLAQANAKYKLVADWQCLIDHEALTKI
ncbi:hypothetical protein [Veillonella sp. R32]|uniref:hypothetical protein n=1 Tax=Veillonella sp. R32 TaxID=2021312 RepID=UPI001389B1A7|nr:hypothetical protein [Veillonella sp. R32]KAF1682275.1 hypothetical protein VER_05955 [Veillonella sp. R32]